MFVNRTVRFTEAMMDVPLRTAIPELWSAMGELASKDTPGVSRKIGDTYVTLAVRDGVHRSRLGSTWSKLAEVVSFAAVNLAQRISPKWADWVGLKFIPRVNDYSHLITTAHEAGHALAAKAVNYTIQGIQTQRVGKGDPHVSFTYPVIKTPVDVLKHVFTLVAGEVSVLNDNLVKRLGIRDVSVLKRAKIQRYGARGDADDIREVLQKALKDGLIDPAYVGNATLTPIAQDASESVTLELAKAVDETFMTIPVVKRMRILFDDMLAQLKPEHYMGFVNDLRFQKRVRGDFGIEYFMDKPYNHDKMAQAKVHTWVMSELERLAQKMMPKKKVA